MLIFFVKKDVMFTIAEIKTIILYNPEAMKNVAGNVLRSIALEPISLFENVDF